MTSKTFDVYTDTKRLASSFSIANLITDKRNVDQTFSSIKLHLIKDKLCIDATDGTLFVRQLLPAQVKSGEIELVIDAKIVERMLRSLPDNLIRISDMAESNQILFSSPNFELKLLCQPSSNFAPFPNTEPELTFKIQQQTLLDMITCTEFSISRDEIRYNLNGIYCAGNSQTGKIEAASTDNFRLSTFSISNQEVIKDFAIILPAKTISLIRNIGSLFEGDVSVSIQNNTVSFYSSTITVISKLIDGSFPRYADLTPSNLPNRLTIDKSVIASSVERIALITDEHAKAIKMHIDSNAISISAYTHSKGSAKQEITKPDFEYTGDPLTIAFQPKYLMDILSLIKGSDQSNVTLAFASPDTPFLVTSDKLKTCAFVIMPIKI